MKPLYKISLIVTVLILFVASSVFFLGYFDTLFETKKPVTAQKEKPYLLKKLDYLSSFIIPDVKDADDFDKLLEGEPTADTFNLTTITSAITQEAIKSFTTPSEHPLPLLAHWNTGDIGSEGMTPEYMISLIEEGNHILPSWRLEPYWKTQLPEDYYRESILRAKELNLPLTFIIDPMESTLTDNSSYFTLSANENPNVIDTNSNILEKISPLGPDSLWSEVGQNSSSSALLQQIQEWYPNPPLVMFAVNANANKLSWSESETSKRFVDRYGSSTDDNYK